MSLSEFSGCSVLVVDDEPMVREVVSAYLERDGFVVTEAGDGPEALRHLDAQQPDLMILDVMLPGTDGLTVLNLVRDRSDTPVILLSARADEADRVVGLEMGADDYVVKPFSPRELATRARTVLRRVSQQRPTGDRIEFEGLTIDPARREVIVGGDLAELPPKEFDLLLFLATSPGQVFSRGQILDHVWDSSSDWQDPSTVTVLTVWGVGYRFDP
jgi:DNA-binding response OmpR family regulator